MVLYDANGVIGIYSPDLDPDLVPEVLELAIKDIKKCQELESGKASTVPSKMAQKMTLLEYLMEQFEVDGGQSPEELDELWVKIKSYYGRDDFVELANQLVLMENLPMELTQKFWDNM